MDWVQSSRLLPEDGDSVQSTKCSLELKSWQCIMPRKWTIIKETDGAGGHMRRTCRLEGIQATCPTVVLKRPCYSGRACAVSYVTGCDLLGKHCPIWTSNCRSDWWPQHMESATISQPLGSEPTSHHLIRPSWLSLDFPGVCFNLKIIKTVLTN